MTRIGTLHPIAKAEALKLLLQIVVLPTPLLLMRTYEYIPEDLFERTFIRVPRHFPEFYFAIPIHFTSARKTQRDLAHQATFTRSTNNAALLHILHSWYVLILLPQGTINNFNIKLSIFRQVLLSIIENSHYNGRAGGATEHWKVILEGEEGKLQFPAQVLFR